MVAEIFRYDCSHIMLQLNDDDDDAKALPTGVPKNDAMKKGGWGGQNVSKSDGVILVCSLIDIKIMYFSSSICKRQIDQLYRYTIHIQMES